jgi:predicted 3-demethylubiquinone-9 3-methyltransferase (glyoxalase superfamily)
MAKKFTTCLWFDGQAEEAMKFYTSVFKDSKKGEILRYGDAGPGPKGQVLTVTFKLNGQDFMGLNGGPQYKFTPAISFVINCETQREVDYYWNKLSKGGTEVQCGWLTDKFGVSWQIVPTMMLKLLKSKNAEKANRAMQAMMQMVKLDIKKLQAAYDGK